jgi:hypothetical protein
MTNTSEIDYYTTEGHDRDAALAMLSQARLPLASRIDEVQVRHLLQIGYRAGRRITEADTTFDRTDLWLTRLLYCIGGAAAGVAIAFVAVWLAA